MSKYKKIPSGTQIIILFATVNFPRPLFFTCLSTFFSIPPRHISKTLSQDVARVGLSDAVRKAFVSSCHLCCSSEHIGLNTPRTTTPIQSTPTVLVKTFLYPKSVSSPPPP